MWGIRRELTWPEQAEKQVVRSGKFWKMNLDRIRMELSSRAIVFHGPYGEGSQGSKCV